MITVGELIKYLSVFDANLPIRVNVWPNYMPGGIYSIYRIFCKPGISLDKKGVEIHCDGPVAKLSHNEVFIEKYHI